MQIVAFLTNIPHLVCYHVAWRVVAPRAILSLTSPLGPEFEAGMINSTWMRALGMSAALAVGRT